MATSQGCCCKPKQPTELPASLRWILPKKKKHKKAKNPFCNQKALESVTSKNTDHL